MRLLWNDDDKPGEIRANSQVWADDGNPLPYVLSYGPRLDEWTACFESTQIARGTLSACLAACESAEEASPVELGNIDEVERLQAELVKVYDAIGSTKYRCPKCGGCWFVPDQFRGDPRFDCPHCEAVEAAEPVMQTHQYRAMTVRDNSTACADCHAPPSHPVHRAQTKNRTTVPR
jgi:hypothetical protein